MRARVAWLSQTRPDVACSVSIVYRITEKNYYENSIKELNTIIQCSQRNPGITLMFPNLYLNSLRLAVYIYICYNNLCDSYSQLGHIICLTDRTNHCSIRQFMYRKSRRIVRSTTPGEAIAFSEGFDSAFIIQHDLEAILRQPISIIMLADSEILFNIFTRNRQTSEKRVTIDIRVAREAHNERVMYNIALISREDNPADAITKIRSNGALRKLLATFKIDPPIRQYVIENETMSLETSEV